MTTAEIVQTRFRRMAQMRAFDEACITAMRSRIIHGELHVGLGQEAIAAGMTESLRPEDAMVSTHRNHYHALAKGVDCRSLLAEICEREDGLCRGRGGHMHPFDLQTNFSATGIVGASVPVALGYAWAFSVRDEDAVAVGVTGDGGSHTGGFHEAMVIAGAERLPLVVLVENNSLAISVKFSDVSPTKTISERASAYAALGLHVDGTDVDAVAKAFSQAMEHARAGRGPVIIEATCHRFRGHFEGDPETYRSKEERRHIRDSFDPLRLYRPRLKTAGISEQEADAMVQEETSTIKALLAEITEWSMPEPAGALNYCFVKEGEE